MTKPSNIPSARIRYLAMYQAIAHWCDSRPAADDVERDINGPLREVMTILNDMAYFGWTNKEEIAHEANCYNQVRDAWMNLRTTLEQVLDIQPTSIKEESTND